MNSNNEELNKKEEEINEVEKYVKELKSKNEKEDKQQEQKQVELPDFLLPQFKNIEEQAKSYKELQALQTRQAQELAEYKKAEELNSKKNLANEEIANLKRQASSQEAKLKEIFLSESKNLELAVQSGKITPKEAQVYAEQLKTFIKTELENIANNFKTSCAKHEENLNMTSPKEFFKDELSMKNYLQPVCEFLERNYKTMPKSELEGIQKLINHLEKTLKEEILNDKQLAQENELYRKNLSSTTNLSPQSSTQKTFTLDEIKKMKPEEFRKNQRVILEQFAAHKIK